jgi:peptide/nickel transport system substrate-binding protein
VWPLNGINELYALYNSWPNWQIDTVYQSLVTVNETAEYRGTVQYLPGLAVNWTVSPDSRTYTFNLRRNVVFSNGDPFNAYQVWMQMYAFYYLSSNSSAWLQSYAFFNMNNVNFGPATMALINQSGLIHPTAQALSLMQNSTWPIYATGPYQIAFHLKSPFLWFPGVLVAFDGLVFDSQFVLTHGGLGTPTSINQLFNQLPIPGTGPFMVTQVLPNSFIKFALNPMYWGRNLTTSQLAQQPLFDPGHVKNVIVNYKPDDGSRYVDLAGNVAQIAAISSGTWNLIRANPNLYSYSVLPAWGDLFSALAFNTQVYPTNITAVRQAIAHAINYTKIQKQIFFGQTASMVGPEYPAWSQFYDLGGSPTYQYNLTLAREELAQAHIQNMPTLIFTTVTECSYCSNIAQIVQSNLGNIGINVNIVITSFAQYSSPYGSYTTNLAAASQLGQLTLMGGVSWSPNAITPADNWVVMVSNGSLYGNWAVYSNPIVQACVNAFTSSSDISSIQALCRSAQSQIYKDAPYAWLGVNELSNVAGALVWKKSVITGFYLDPIFTGEDTAPLFNTVTFA